MVAFYMMSGGRHPFEAASDDDVEAKIENGQPDLSSVTDVVAHDLVKKMLEDTPANRPAAKTLLKYSHLALLSAIYLPCLALQHSHCGRCRTLMRWH